MPLRFGVPSLDNLLEIPRDKTEERNAATSLAILGPDGTGKSVLALHLASTYLRDCRQKLLRRKTTDCFLPKVLYVSSDLRLKPAEKVWQNFSLGDPCRRQIPFELAWESIERLGLSDPDQDMGHRNSLEIRLKSLTPGSRDSRPEDADCVSSFLAEEIDFSNDAVWQATLGFMDLAEHTAGDDWSFVNSLLGRLESVRRPKLSGKDSELQHLVIIDSVAGFETFVGKLDAHGLEQSRRARIAQCMRNSGQHCHLVFVVEEPKELERLPEEYVTDVVLRLRLRAKNDRAARTVEIEKARARSHASGEHPFEIRGPSGSSTGEWQNPDNPKCKNAYIQVFHTISHRYFLAAQNPGPGRGQSSSQIAPFGLPYLDDLLTKGPRVDSGQQAFGLRCGSIGALLGDSSTGKSALAEQLLAEAFRTVVEDFCALYSSLRTGTPSLTSWNRVLGSISTSAMDPTSDRPQNCSSITFQDLLDSWTRGKEASADDLLTLTDNMTPVGYLEDELPDKWRQAFNSVERRNARLTELCGTETEKKKSRISLLKFPDPPEHVDLGSCLDHDLAVTLLTKIFDHPNLRFPGILLTTSDKKSDDVAARCMDYLGIADPILAGNVQPTFTSDNAADIRARLITLVSRQLITRRFDIDNVTSAELIHLIMRNVNEAQGILFTSFFPPNQNHRAAKSGRIQLVIDDFRVLCNTCPDVMTNSLILPFLIFTLEREGVTSVIVYTDAVRPDQRPDNEMSRVLLSLVSQSIYLWNVPFEGRNRIAIGVVPPSSDEVNGVIRELRLNPAKTRPSTVDPTLIPTLIPTVTRHFELYAGIEEGHPRRVPLAIYLFDETLRLKDYVKTQEAVFRELFLGYALEPSPSAGCIFHTVSAPEYSSLQDYAHLPADTQLGHTMIFQIDGHWSLNGDGALNSMRDYLYTPQTNVAPVENQEDPFGVFRGTQPLCKPKFRPEDKHYRKIDYFSNKYYESRLTHGDLEMLKGNVLRVPDRVPFMWDFGFVLARKSLWQGAGDSTAFKKGDTEITVADVLAYLSWNRTDDLGDRFRDRLEVLGTFGWRAFFGACKQAAARFEKRTRKRVVPFDLSTPSQETMNCFILELWFSEIQTLRQLYSNEGKDRLWDDSVKLLSTAKYKIGSFNTHGEGGNRSSVSLLSLLETNGPSLEECFKKLRQAAKAAQQSQTGNEEVERALEEIPIAAFALYRCWLLLLEVLDFSSYCDPSNSFLLRRTRDASLDAAATRQWYNTACDFSERIHAEPEKRDPVTLLRLPGTFSARGDWFLGTPTSSRSRLLAYYAIDLISSRRANISRLEIGMGLPVRDVLSDEQCGKIRTALACEYNDTLEQVKYGELVDRCGGTHADQLTETTPQVALNNGGLFWLWRASLQDYDRQSRVLQTWLARLFNWTVRYQREHESGWVGGFRAYDGVTESTIRIEPYESLEQFGAHCDFLVAELDAASRQHACTAPIASDLRS